MYVCVCAVILKVFLHEAYTVYPSQYKHWAFEVFPTAVFCGGTVNAA